MLKSLTVIAPAVLGLAFVAPAFAANHAGKPKADAKPAAAAPAETGRDWRRIDTNGDGLISPDEMEKWLAANPGPLATRK